MDEYAVVPLLEGVNAAAHVLSRTHQMTIGEVQCRMLPPGHFSGQVTRANELRRLGPPQSGNWPEADWGYYNTDYEVTIRALGLAADRAALADTGLAAFDTALTRWKRLLRDWLAVLAYGPTDFVERQTADVTWATVEREREAETILGPEDFHMPHPVQAWEWDHAMEHIRAGDEPPLARTLLTTAMRAQSIGDGRSAALDAATAAEVALANSLTTWLSAEASPTVAKALVDRTRMLGPRLELARELGLTVPDRHRTKVKLLDLRNAVVHRGVEVTASEAQEAIEVARKLVEYHEPLPPHCEQWSYGELDIELLEQAEAEFNEDLDDD